mmetsp:Transcript_21624/g.30232  ORF Transcript_21624/g.30232 Transcript_21624/m.30232 type:complete len:398 (+) Transcript_21624:79-1272(+)
MPRAAAKKDAPKKRKEPEEEVEEEVSEEEEEEEKPKKKTTKAKKAKSEKDNAGESAAPIVTDWTKPEKKEGQLKLASWNVAGWAAIIKKGFQEYVKNEDPDIICLQETKIDPKNVKDGYLEGYHQHFYACDSNKGYSGTAIFSKIKPISWTDGIGIKEHDTEGRVITAEYENFFLVNTYIPNSSRGLVNLDYRQKWDKDFREYLKKLDKQKPVIWTGDLNVAHLEIDLANPKTNRNKTAGFTDQERDGMTQVLKSGFVDSFRHLYPQAEGVYSYWTYVGNARAKNVGWRLDYWIISQRLVEKLGDTVMRPGVMGSDHCPIVLLISLKDGKLLPYVEIAAPAEDKPAENNNNSEKKEEPKKEEAKADEKKEEAKEDDKKEEKPAQKKKAAPKKGKKTK